MRWHIHQSSDSTKFYSLFMISIPIFSLVIISLPCFCTIIVFPSWRRWAIPSDLHLLTRQRCLNKILVWLTTPTNITMEKEKNLNNKAEKMEDWTVIILKMGKENCLLLAGRGRRGTTVLERRYRKPGKLQIRPTYDPINVLAFLSSFI